MSVIYGPLWEQLRPGDSPTRLVRHDEAETYDAHFAARLPHATCMYCDHEMTFPGIYWMAATGDVWLHPACVVDWSIRLLRDVHEYECVTHRSTTVHPFAAPE